MTPSDKKKKKFQKKLIVDIFYLINKIKMIITIPNNIMKNSGHLVYLPEILNNKKRERMRRKKKKIGGRRLILTMHLSSLAICRMKKKKKKKCAFQFLCTLLFSHREKFSRAEFSYSSLFPSVNFS